MKPSVPTASVHGDRHLPKSLEPLAREVFLRRQRPDKSGEDEELRLFRAQEWLKFEEGDHLGEEIRSFADHEHESRVLGATVIRSYVTALQAFRQ